MICLTGAYDERKKMQKNSFWIPIFTLVIAFALSACGSSAGEATPTVTPVDINAVYTQAAQTVIAQLTQQAPTITPTPVFTDTPNVTATPTIGQATSTRVPATAASCANYFFVDDITIKDGMQMPVGTEFTKTWRVKNTGTCTWTTNFKLVFVRGEAMGGQAFSLANAVATGQTVDISINLKVPDKSGKLTGVWSLVDEKGQYFGAVLTVVINVGTLTPSPTGSAAITPTLTPEAGTTATPTETPTISLTPAS
jgi:hypothetical protein